MHRLVPFAPAAHQSGWTGAICLADFVAPVGSGSEDYIGAFAVTAGIGIDEHVKRFEKAHDDYSAIILKAWQIALPRHWLSTCTQRTRHEFWGYAAGESLSNEELICGEVPRHSARAGLPRLSGSH